MKRLFLAIPINLHYTILCQQFIAHQQFDKVRWVKAENWHITLVFIGDFPKNQLESLINHLNDFFSKMQTFDLQFDKFIYKPDPKKPRMIWVRFKHSHQFDELVNNPHAYLKEFYHHHKLDFNIQIRNTNVPHITLARLKNEFQKFPKLKDNLNDQPLLNVKDCHLFESVLLPKGVEYHLLHTFSFNASS